MAASRMVHSEDALNKTSGAEEQFAKNSKLDTHISRLQNQNHFETSSCSWF